MEICIKIENPTEEELELIKDLSRIGSEKKNEERIQMKQLLFEEMPNMMKNSLKEKLKEK